LPSRKDSESSDEDAVPREANELVGKEYNDRGIGRHPTARDDDNRRVSLWLVPNDESNIVQGFILDETDSDRLEIRRTRSLEIREDASEIARRDRGFGNVSSFQKNFGLRALRAGIRTCGKKRDPGNCEIYVSVYFNENQETVMFDTTIVIVSYERFESHHLRIRFHLANIF